MTAISLPTSEPLRTVGDYQILAEIARGGMGRVYLARRTAEAGFERHFAIKVMHQNLTDDRDATLMLLDEAHIASRMHHPNVVSVIDIGVYDGGFYLVMDYVEGCSLHQLMRRNKKERPPRWIIPMFLETLHGLHAVHTLCDANGEPYNVVHRDISPQNLLVGLDGGCRVTDFGIAKAAARFTDTRTGTHKGKLSFMAPEQIEGKGLDLRADLWAVGVTLYAALTGVHPFRGDTDPMTMHNIMSRVPPPPSTIGLEPPACFDATVLKLLERDPDKRHASAKEAGDELRRLALAEGHLGAPSEIAEWVESSFGKELTARRKRLGELHAIDGPLDSQESLPRLWLSTGPGSNPSGRRVRATDGEEPTVAEPSTKRLSKGRTRRWQRRVLAVMLASAVIGALAVLALAGSDGEEGSQGVESVDNSTGAVVTPHEPPLAELTETPEEVNATTAPQELAGPSASAEGEPAESEAPATGRRLGTAPGSDRSRRRGGRGRAARSTPTVEATEPVATPSPPSTPPPTQSPAPVHQRLERNPYLRRE